MNLLSIFLISLIPRLIFLFFGMPSITHDEADFFLNSYYLAKTGTNIFNKLIFATSGHLTANASIPVYIGTIPFLFLEKNIIISRFPYAIISVFTPIFFYLFLKNLFNNKIAFLTALIFSLSPWFSYMSTQAAVEQIIYLFFFSTSLYLSLFLNKNIKFRFLFYLSLFLMFNSYMGGKIPFPFFVFNFYLINNLFNKEEINLKKIIKYLFNSLILSLIFIIILLIFSNKYLFERSNDTLIIFNKNLIENNVWYERLTTIDSNLIKKIISNKITVIYKLFIEKYIEAFNLKYLFITGDPHPIYGNNVFGLFYSWQIILFLYGLSYFIINLKNDKIYLYILFFILSIPITIGINSQETTIALRAFPLSFFYSFLISLGFFQLITLFTRKKDNINILFKFIIILNIFSFFYFFLIYYSRIQILSAEQWHFSEKKLFEKIKKDKLTDLNKKIIILNEEPEGLFLLYSFYYINDANLIKNKFIKNNFFYNNLFFKKNNYFEIIEKNKNSILLIKRGHYEIEKKCQLIKNCSVFLEASDKSGPIYYKISI